MSRALARIDVYTSIEVAGKCGENPVSWKQARKFGKTTGLVAPALFPVEISRFNVILDYGLHLGENCGGHSQEWLCYKCESKAVR
jgi:hypothetical protein